MWSWTATHERQRRELKEAVGAGEAWPRLAWGQEELSRRLSRQHVDWVRANGGTCICRDCAAAGTGARAGLPALCFSQAAQRAGISIVER